MIVYLVGMPGAGKSVVGKELAGRLGVPFIDLDAEIERDAGRAWPTSSPPRARRRSARARRRRSRTRACTIPPSWRAAAASSWSRPTAITLRNTGVAVFLDVPLEQLHARVRPAADRPLIREEGDLERLLSDREPLYREFAAHVVDGTGAPAEVADAIVEELRWSA